MGIIPGLSLLGLVCVLLVTLYIFKHRSAFFGTTHTTPAPYSSLEISSSEQLGQILVAELGKLEGVAKGLVSIIVICDKIEDPIEDPSLLKSVKSNFLRGVEYHFFVSPSNMHQREGYFRIYEGYANALIQEGRAPLNVQQLVDIQPLSSDWKNYPYVFYTCRDEEEDGRFFTFGFRGSQHYEGIAISYFFLHPEVAHTVLDLAMRAHTSLDTPMIASLLNNTEFVPEHKVVANILPLRLLKSAS